MARAISCQAGMLLWAAAAVQLLAMRPTAGKPALDAATTHAAQRYPWKRRFEGYQPLSSRFALPAGFQRVPLPAGSFGEWLRGLPLLPSGTPVRAFDGHILRRGDDPSVAGVVDLDLSRRDRQQCADTILRLRGEYLHASGRTAEARFLWAGGKRFSFADWQRGLRPLKKAGRWSFEPEAPPSSGYASYRAYLEYLFSWTGTQHLAGEPRVQPQNLAPGDFFIQAGSPGHAVIVMDLARDSAGHRRALIGQGFMPAQDLHLLRSDDGNAWFELEPPRALRTPFWRPFAWNELHRFR